MVEKHRTAQDKLAVFHLFFEKPVLMNKSLIIRLSQFPIGTI
jgi:hypothetical protein